MNVYIDVLRETLEMKARSEKYMNVSDEDDRQEEQRVKVTTIFNPSQKREREARIDDHLVLEEPEEHAVSGGRDVSLHYEGGHNPEHHTVALETPTSSRNNEPLRPDLTEAEHVVVNFLPVDRGHQPLTINHEGCKAE